MDVAESRSGRHGDDRRTAGEVRAPEDRDAAFTALVRDHRLAIHAVARNLCGDDVAADVTQEVFVRLWRNPDGFDPSRGSMRQYVVTLARGTAIDHLRRRSSQRTNDLRRHLDDTWMVQRDADPLVEADIRVRIVAAVDALPSTEREAITAAFFLHLTYRQVAVGLGIAEGTAKSRIRSGLSRLRVELVDVRPQLFG